MPGLDLTERSEACMQKRVQDRMMILHSVGLPIMDQLPFFLGFPASERFFRQEPSLLRDLGCFPTWGIPLPALLSVAMFHLPSFVRK